MTTELTARDTMVALLGEAKADEVIEQAARAEYASDCAGEDWDREGAEFRELYLTPVTAALAAVLPGLLARGDHHPRGSRRAAGRGRGAGLSPSGAE